MPVDILGKHGCLEQNGRGKVNRSRPTHYDIGMSLHYAYNRHTIITMPTL